MQSILRLIIPETAVWEALTVGNVLFVKKELQLVHAVDWAILRNLRSADACKHREEVNDVNGLVADTACGNRARPAKDERCSQ